MLKPLEEQNGGVVEVNAAPACACTSTRRSARAARLVRRSCHMMFAPGDNARIPVVAIAGTNGKTTTSQLIGRIFRKQRPARRNDDTDGLYIQENVPTTATVSGPRSLAQRPAADVDAAVFETARGGVLREGFGFDMCDVAVITNIGIGDHLGLNFITTVDELAVVKRVIVENVAPGGRGSLNAADPIVVAMAQHCPVRSSSSPRIA